MAQARNLPNTKIDGNATRTHLSTNIIIKVANNIVGAVTSLSYKETRSIKMIDQIGTDGHIDGAPSSSVKITGNCDRTRFDGARIAEAFSRGFVHLHSQRYPFDIEIHDTFANSNSGKIIVTVLEGVWLNDLGATYSSNDYIIVDKLSFECERIYSTFKGGGPVVQAASSIGTIKINPYEQEADSGKFTGSLDKDGLLRELVDLSYAG